MVISYFCDLCKCEQERSSLKTITISDIYTDNNCEDPHRTIASLRFELCRNCFLENESKLRREVEEMQKILEVKL